MTAIDTNVLVRYLVLDNLEQAEAARELLEGLTPEQPGFICREVILEVVWVLERTYGFSRDQIADVLLELAATDTLVIEAAEDVVSAAEIYRQGGTDFSDLMILAAAINAGAGPLYTFDRKFARLDEVVLLNTEPQSTPQLLVQPPYPSSGHASEWIPLPELPTLTDTKPAEILFPDNSRVKIENWVDLPVETIRWLLDNNLLRQNHYPITLGRSYILAESPFNPNGGKFIAHKQVGNLYISTNYSADNQARHTRIIIERTGQDPAQFKVRLR